LIGSGWKIPVKKTIRVAEYNSKWWVQRGKAVPVHTIEVYGTIMPTYQQRKTLVSTG
jgi:hypothetical protein